MALQISSQATGSSDLISVLSLPHGFSQNPSPQVLAQKLYALPCHMLPMRIGEEKENIGRNANVSVADPATV